MPPLYGFLLKDIVTANMGHALAAEGGFCTGSTRVIDPQRLSSSGYVFSASLPPYIASAAIIAIDILEKNPELLSKLKNNIYVLWKGLSKVPGLKITSNKESPIVYLRLEKSTGSQKDDPCLVEKIAQRVFEEDSIFVVVSHRSSLDKCRLPVGIRLFVSVGHSEYDLRRASESLKRVSAQVLGGHN
ncbi:long chain base biosynthesis protein 1-like [Arachis stenosperma]|uniref:long chain base biosynthesis protein 1-like n=1 Tax=Arachis stenosperma TaxID=217475 RepID=UPI0025AC649A|nr:long chain base biosynthesis protein 1-like [Arachis stenosperma]